MPTPWLWKRTVIYLSATNISSAIPSNQILSFLVCNIIYIELILLDVATLGFILALKLTVPAPYLKIQPVGEQQSSVVDTQSES